MEPASPSAPPTTTARRRRRRRIGRLPGLSSSSPVASLPLLLVLLLCLLCLLLLPVPSHGATTATSTQIKTKKEQKFVVSFSSEELLDHLEEWTTDVAIFFYAPWCPYCKLVGPYWDMVGEWHAEQPPPTPSLLIARFDCEQDALATDICLYMGVTHYPTIQYLGYGSYYQQSIWSFLSKLLIYFRLSAPKVNVERAVFFEGIPDPEVLKDWTNMMRGISSWHRWRKGGRKGRKEGGLALEKRKERRRLEREVEELKEEKRWLEAAVRKGGKEGGVGGGGGGGGSGGGKSLYEEWFGPSATAGAGAAAAGGGGGGGGGGKGKEGYGGSPSPYSSSFGQEEEEEEDSPWAAATAAAKEAAATGEDEALEKYYQELMRSLEGGKEGRGKEGQEATSPEEVEAALEKMAEEILGPVRGGRGGGDPFEELAEGGLRGNETGVVLECLGDFMGDYCREVAEEGGGEGGGEEPFCNLLPGCVKDGFGRVECRPARCPLREEGCERIKNCLREGVMGLYAQMMPKEGGKEAGGGGGDKAGSSWWGMGGGGGGDKDL